MTDRMSDRGSVPVPDPTKLTTDAVAAAKIELKELFDTKLTGFRELVTEKFAGRDTALAAALKSAQELVKQQNDSNTLAIDKASSATTKQIDALDAKIADLKERLQGVATWPMVMAGASVLIAFGSLVVLVIKH